MLQTVKVSWNKIYGGHNIFKNIYLYFDKYFFLKYFMAKKYFSRKYVCVNIKYCLAIFCIFSNIFKYVFDFLFLLYEKYLNILKSRYIYLRNKMI